MVISSLMFGFIWDDVYPFCIFSFRGEDFVGRDVRPGSGPGPGPGPGSGSGLRGREASTIVVYGSEYKEMVEYCENAGQRGCLRVSDEANALRGHQREEAAAGGEGAPRVGSGTREGDVPGRWIAT